MAVEFDGDSHRWPGEVSCGAPDAQVDLGFGQACQPYEPEEETLEVASSAVGVGLDESEEVT